MIENITEWIQSNEGVRSLSLSSFYILALCSKDS